MYKAKKHLSPLPMQELFSEQTNPYNLRNKRCWDVPKVRTVYNGTETIRFRGPKIWSIVPSEIKNSNSLTEFKYRIKGWKPSECTCRLCRTYVQNLGFIN